MVGIGDGAEETPFFSDAFGFCSLRNVDFRAVIAVARSSSRPFDKKSSSNNGEEEDDDDDNDDDDPDDDPRIFVAVTTRKLSGTTTTTTTTTTYKRIEAVIERKLVDVVLIFSVFVLCFVIRRMEDV